MLFQDRDLIGLDAAGRRHYRKSVQAVLQDPYASLNPRMRIGAIIAEPLITNETVEPAQVRQRVLELLDLVGLPAARPICSRTNSRAAAAPAHRHRARARPVAQAGRAGRAGLRLDVSIRAQILNLLRDLQARLGLSYLFIAHDLAAVAHMSHQIVVMYLGKIVERRGAGDCRQSAASLHQGAVRRRPAQSSRRTARGRAAGGRSAEPTQPALRMPFPPALPARHAALRPTGAAAGPGRGSPGRLPPLRLAAQRQRHFGPVGRDLADRTVEPFRDVISVVGDPGAKTISADAPKAELEAVCEQPLLDRYHAVADNGEPVQRRRQSAEKARSSGGRASQASAGVATAAARSRGSRARSW